LVTTHVLSDWSPGNSPEFDLATLQRRVADTDAGATDCLSFITSNDNYGIPVFNSEGVWALSTVTRTRVATWTHVMAGGFSMVAHFAIDGTHRTSSWGVTWDSVNPRHKEDAAEMGKLAKFFNHTLGIDINSGVPHHELVRVSDGRLALCLAQPGESYYIWLDRGGAPSLDLTGISGEFTVTRYRCTDLAHPDTLAAISGGGIRTLEATPTTGFGNDYLYVVTRLIIVNTIDIIAPNGGEQWNAATMAAVSWSSSGAIANVNIDLSSDGGLTYPVVLAANTPNDGNESIKVPSIITAQARVRVSNASDSAIFDFSDANFAITDAPDLTPPVVTITLPASNGQTFKGNIAVSGIATDDAGVAKVEWQLDCIVGTWNLAAGANKWSFSIPQPADGCHTVYVRATDIATPTNTSVPVARHFFADNTGPRISDVRITDVRETIVTIAWNTDEAADSRVQWGTAPNNYTDDTGIVETGVTKHAVTLDNLAVGTVYHFIVMSSDTVGNLSTSPDFTLTISRTIIADDFNTGATAEKFSSASIPASFAMRNYPNPFSASEMTRIRLGMPQDAEIRLSVFALSGREVRELVAGSFCTGNHEVIWDGRNREGRALSTGVYLLRLRYRTDKGGAWAQSVHRVLMVK
jgi:hypothetical protein